jgi:hypothetical protein
MPTKLDLATSLGIVQTAVGAVRRGTKPNRSDTLGNLIPDEGERENFRQTVQKLVGEIKFKIAAEAVPIAQHTTLQDIAQAVTMSALPGNPYIFRVDEEAPAPPPPRKDIAFELPGEPNVPKTHDDEPTPPPAKPKTQRR